MCRVFFSGGLCLTGRTAVSSFSFSNMLFLQNGRVRLGQGNGDVGFDVKGAADPVAEAVFVLQAWGKWYIRQGQEGFEFFKVASVPVEHIVRVIKIIMYDGRIGRNQFFV